MSETTTAPESLGYPPPAGRQLRGNLGVASIVFMVVAAAAPLGVIGGVVPLGIASGNGAGFPATFIAATAVLLLFAVGFTAMTPYVDEAGAFFSYVRQALGLPTGIGIAFVALVSYVALEAGVYGLLGPAGASVVELAGGPALPWWVFAAVAFAVTTYLGYRNIELSSRVLGVLLTAEIAIVLVLDLVIVANGGDHGLSSGIVNPICDLLRITGHRAALRDHQLRRIRGHRDLPRRGPHSRADDSAGHLPGADPDRGVLRGHQLGVDLGVGRRAGHRPRHRLGLHLPRRHRAPVHRRGRRRHHHGAVFHQPVRLHPGLPQRRVAVRVRALAARRASPRG